MFVLALTYVKLLGFFFFTDNCLINPTMLYAMVFQEAADDVGSGNLGANEKVGHVQPPLLASLLHQVLFGPLVKR